MIMQLFCSVSKTVARICAMWRTVDGVHFPTNYGLATASPMGDGHDFAHRKHERSERLVMVLVLAIRMPIRSN